MRCPFCSCEDTKVIDSRLSDGSESVRRRRQCQSCTERFTTYEQFIYKLPQVIKSDGRREPFDEGKLRRGITRAIEKRPIDIELIEGAINRILKQFTHKGERELPGQEIGEAVMNELRVLDEVAYVRFASVYRCFQDLEAFNQTVKHLRQQPESKRCKAQHPIPSKNKIK